MTATRLRLILFGVIALLTSGLAGGAWWLQGVLAEHVRQTDHARTDALVSGDELNELKALKEQLATEQDVVERAKQIAVSTEQYRYQDQVVADISGYAARYGIEIGSFDFSIAQGKKAEKVGAATKTAFAISVRGQVPYATFLRFLQDIENNLTKIQVTSLTLTPAEDPNNITNPSLGLEVFIKD